MWKRFSDGVGDPMTKGSGDHQVLPMQGHGAVQGSRRWPFLVLLLSVTLLLGASPWWYTQFVPSRYEIQIFGGLQLFGSRLYPDSIPADFIYNPFGRDWTDEKAADILKCMRSDPASTSLPSANPVLPAKECPAYFQLIHKDLEPWKETGITQEMIDWARPSSFIRVVILDSELYVERYRPCFANRAIFNVWGVLLFLKKFKGQVPDLEFVFNCDDVPRLQKGGRPAVMFAYDSNSQHFDIPFPDWSFWGWSELMISPWDEKREAIAKGSEKTDWQEKVPRAYWTGNPYVGAPHRRELLKCHQAKLTEIRSQNWGVELAKNKEHSKLEDQCTHKFMIYTEGNGWSVSCKYIFSCGSPTLAISPFLYDFFSRGLRQWVHYIPIRPSALVAPEMCDVLDRGVEWAVANETEALRIGKAGQDFMRNELSMENVYNYMFHLLREYAQLLKFKPEQGSARLITIDQLLCLVPPGIDRDTLLQSLKAMPTNPTPCQMSESPENIFEPDWETISPA